VRIQWTATFETGDVTLESYEYPDLFNGTPETRTAESITYDGNTAIVPIADTTSSR
jgi:hypothetical protein